MDAKMHSSTNKDPKSNSVMHNAHSQSASLLSVSSAQSACSSATGVSPNLLAKVQKLTTDYPELIVPLRTAVLECQGATVLPAKTSHSTTVHIPVTSAGPMVHAIQSAQKVQWNVNPHQAMKVQPRAQANILAKAQQWTANSAPVINACPRAQAHMLAEAQQWTTKSTPMINACPRARAHMLAKAQQWTPVSTPPPVTSAGSMVQTINFINAASLSASLMAIANEMKHKPKTVTTTTSTHALNSQHTKGNFYPMAQRQATRHQQGIAPTYLVPSPSYNANILSVKVTESAYPTPTVAASPLNQPDLFYSRSPLYNAPPASAQPTPYQQLPFELRPTFYDSTASLTPSETSTTSGISVPSSMISSASKMAKLKTRPHRLIDFDTPAPIARMILDAIAISPYDLDADTRTPELFVDQFETYANLLQLNVEQKRALFAGLAYQDDAACFEAIKFDTTYEEMVDNFVEWAWSMHMKMPLVAEMLDGRSVKKPGVMKRLRKLFGKYFR